MLSYCFIDADRLDTERFDSLERFNLRNADKPIIQQLYDIFRRTEKISEDEEEIDEGSTVAQRQARLAKVYFFIHRKPFLG